jgi:hypothetical protein
MAKRRKGKRRVKMSNEMKSNQGTPKAEEVVGEAQAVDETIDVRGYSCPLLSISFKKWMDCCREQCQWWVEDRNGCAVRVLTESLEEESEPGIVYHPGESVPIDGTQ